MLPTVHFPTGFSRKTGYSSFIVHRSLFIIYRSLIIAHCLLLTVHCPSFTVYRSLFIAHCSFFIVYYSLFISVIMEAKVIDYMAWPQCSWGSFWLWKAFEVKLYWGRCYEHSWLRPTMERGFLPANLYEHICLYMFSVYFTANPRISRTKFF